MSVDRVYHILKMLEVSRGLSKSSHSEKQYSNVAKNVKKMDELNLDNYNEINAGKKILGSIQNIIQN